MRLMHFTFTISHVPGKDLTIADTLSHALSTTVSHADVQFSQDTEMFVNTVMSCLPTAEKRLAEVKQKQQEDEVCQQLKSYCKSGWPDQRKVPAVLKPYFLVSSELTIQHGILMHNNRIVILLLCAKTYYPDYTQDIRESLSVAKELHNQCGGPVSARS